MNDSYYMKIALEEAKKASLKKEVPVGCVIVKDGKIIAKAHNTRHQKKSVLDHAEIVAIKKASKKLDSWILDGTTLYVTLEPCLMCAGVILHSRIKRVVFGTHEPKFGAVGSVINVFDSTKYAFNHQVEVTSGILEDDSKEILKKFFKDLRENKKKL